MPRVYVQEHWIINDDSALNGLFRCTYLTNSRDYLVYVVHKWSIVINDSSLVDANNRASNIDFMPIDIGRIPFQLVTWP